VGCSFSRYAPCGPRVVLWLVVMVVLSQSGAGQTIGPASPYPVVFFEDFEDQAATEARWLPRENYTFAPGWQGQGICIANIQEQTTVIAAAFPLAGMRGGMITLSARIKGENISQPPNHWNGVKVMLHVQLQDGSSLWPQVPVGSGSFDWLNQGVLIGIPDAAVSAVLYLGLEACSGTVWFDDVCIRLVADPDSYPGPRDPSIPIDKCHNLGMLRGAMVATNLEHTDGAVLGRDWNANVVRWQLGGCSYPEGLLTPDYDTILANELALLDDALRWCRRYGLLVVVDLHSLSQGLFSSAAAQQKLVSVWQTIAARYRDEDIVWAYDLANEPDPRGGAWGNGSVLIWEDLADRVVRAIRQVDADTPIIIESVYAAPWTFTHLRPLDFSLTRIIYSAHMYEPHRFTHQTLLPEYAKSCRYPGIINGTYWGKLQLMLALAPVSAFQWKYRVPVFIGEFSAIRWAPEQSAFRYIRDCCAIFDQLDWDWCYHAFREWHGWSVEHSEDPNDLEPSVLPTRREKLLRVYFGRNEKP